DGKPFSHNPILTSEEVSIRFLTRLRHKRHIRKNDFHILEVRRPSQNSSFHVHLAKSNHLVSPDL
ncbi:unnamed protein product, partial [Allacma fusca]